MVVATIRDKGAAEAQDEIAALRKELDDVSHALEIIRAKNHGEDEDEDENVAVYASGQFQDGTYERIRNFGWSSWNKKTKTVADLVTSKIVIFV